MANQYKVRASVDRPIKGGYRLKVDVPDLGLYMHGFRALESDRNPSGWWIQGPCDKGTYKPNPEFDKKKALWLEIEESCINAVKSDGSEPDVVYSPELSELTDEAIAKSLDESIKKFGLDEKPGKAIPWMDED